MLHHRQLHQPQMCIRDRLKGFGPVQGIRGAFWALGALTLPVCLMGSALLTAQMCIRDRVKAYEIRDSLQVPCWGAHQPTPWV